MAGPPLPLKLVESDANSMYQSAPKIYVREVQGRWQRLRTASVFWLLGMFYLGPWLNWDGRQAVLFDLPARRFYVFGLSFWPQDFVYLTWLLVIAGLALFFFTALAGRLWCGYACPQTVWTEVFLWLERLAEGPHSKRRKLDQGPWTGEKIRRKAFKQFLWISFALWTGFTFVGFFTPIRDLGSDLLNASVGGWPTFWMLFYGLATYGNAGYLREQVCKYMCPYARFQGAMFDRNTLVISYDPARGEPRGSRRRGSDAASQGLGDCIDCTVCVQVCPTGIDIRQGLQYECIACGACVDACDTVMDKVGSPRGLIRYSTENAMVGLPSRILRPRILLYGVALLALVVGFMWSVTQRNPLGLEVLRDRNALYRLHDGHVENTYTLKIVNKARADQPLRLQVFSASGLPFELLAPNIVVPAERVETVPITLRLPSELVSGRTEISFQIETLDAPAWSADRTSAFFAPVAAENSP